MVVVQKLLEKAIEQKIFAGAACAVLQKGKAPLFYTEGGYDYNPESPRIKLNSIFDCASLTKVIPTSLIALRLWQKGVFKLDDAILPLCPELSMRFKEQITWRHLLTHTLDYRISLSSLKDLSPSQIEERLFSFEFEKAPGESYLYCNASSWLLGVCLEKVTQKSFSILAQEEVFDELGLKTATLFPLQKFAQEHIVPTENCPWRKRVLQGEIHDESAWAMRPEFSKNRTGRVVGSAGMFSDITDVAKVAQMFLEQGQTPHGQFLNEPIWNEFVQGSSFNLNGAIQKVGLGLEMNNPRFMGQNHSPMCFGKTGFTGCSFVVDLEKAKGVVLLSNFTWPTREKTPERIFDFRSELADAVWAQNLG